MKKWFQGKTKLIVGLLTMLVLIFFCSSITLAETIKIKIGSYDPKLVLTLNETNGQMASTNVKAQAFKTTIEAISGGRFQVDIFPNGQLGNDREAFEMVKTGSLQMSAYPGNMLSNFVPEIKVLDIPYTFKDEVTAFRVLEGDFGRELADMVLKKTGVRIIQWGIDGPYENIFTVSKQIKVPSDLKGVKIRVSNNAPHVEALKFAGGSPVPMAWTEVYTSLETGVIDGLVTGLPYAINLKADHILKYVTIARPFLSVSNLFVNEKFFQSLSKEDQLLILKAGQKAMRTYSGLELWGADLMVDYYTSKGMTVYHPTPSEMKEWEKAIQVPMTKWVEKKIGKEWITKLENAVSKAEEELYGF
jgi:tripartite ATP-independent transporter DctP family solute receptor